MSSLRRALVSIYPVLFLLFLMPAALLAQTQPQQPLSPAEQAANSLEASVQNHLVHGRFAQAQAAYTDLQANHATSRFYGAARAYYADIDFHHGKFKDAISGYNAAMLLATDPNDRAAISGKIGLAYMQSGDLASAKQNLITALSTTRWDDKTAVQTWLLRLSMREAEALSTGRFSECGRESLSIALAMMGRKAEAEAVKSTKVKDLSGLSVAEIIDLAKAKGVECWAIKVDEPGLEEVTCPFVAHYGERHFVTVESISDGKVTIVDPFKGQETLSLEEFVKSFTGEAIVFAKSDVEKGRVLTVAEASEVRGGCTTPVPGGSDNPCHPEGDNKGTDPDHSKDCKNSCPCPPCDQPPANQDPDDCVPPNADVFGVNYGIISDIPCFAPLDAISVGGAGNRFLGSATVSQSSGTGGRTGGMIAVSGGGGPNEHVLTTGRVGGVASSSYGLSHTGGTGCATCGGKSSIMAPTGLRKGGSVQTTFSVPSFNANNLNVILPILPVYYSAGLGPDFQPAVIYYSQGTSDDGFGPKWNFVYQAARYRYTGDTTIFITMTSGAEIRFDLVNGVWTAQDGNNLKLTVLGSGDMQVYEPDTFTTYTFEYGSTRLTAITDPWGESLTIQRSPAGKVSKVTTADGRENYFYYDPNDLCTRITSAVGDNATFAYSAAGVMTQVTDMGEGTSTYYYDDTNYLTTRTTALGTDGFAYLLPAGGSQETRVAYTSRAGRVRSLYWSASDGANTLVEVAKGSYTARSYKPTTQGVTCIFTGLSGQTEDQAVQTYDRDQKGYITRVGELYGSTRYYTSYYRDTDHNITKISHPDGTEQSYGYDSSDRLTAYTSAFGTRTYQRGSNGIITKVTEPDSTYVQYAYASDGRLTTYTDKLGNNTVFDYDPYGYLTRANYAGAEELQYSVNLAGLVTKYSDPLSNSTSYLYDGYLRATRATYPNSAYTTRTFSCCNLTATQDGNGAVTNYYYDSDGTLSKTTDPLGNNTIVYYDNAYHLTKYTDALGNSTSYLYDTALTRMTKITYPDTSSMAYYLQSGMGQLTKTTYATGASKTYYYAYGNRLTKVNDGKADTTYYYDTNSALVTKASSTGMGDSLVYYDTYGVITQLTDQRGKNCAFAYNSVGLMTRASGPLSHGNSFYYDALGRLTQSVGGEQTGASYSYDQLNRTTQVASPEGPTALILYDSMGRVTASTNAVGAQTAFERDGNGATTKATGPTGISVAYLRDAAGRVTNLQNQTSAAITYSYNALGRVTLLTDANSKTASQYYSNMGAVTKLINGNGYATTYSYAPGSVLTMATKPNGKSTYFAFDQWGGLTKWRQYYQDGDNNDPHDLWDHQQWFYPDAQGRNTKKADYYETGFYDSGKWTGHVKLTRSTIYSYDAGSLLTKIDFPSIPDVTFAYDDAGQLTSTSDSTNSTAYSYDAAARATSSSFSYDSGALAKSVAYQYDRASRLTRFVDGQGTAAVYAFDPAGRLSTVTEGGALRATYGVDQAGKVTRLVCGTGSYTDYAYDANALLTLVDNRKSDGTSISAFSYYLDPIGMCTRMDIGGSAYTAASVAYGYDSAYELTTETRTGGNPYSQSYYYDNSGNRTKDVLGGTATNYYYDYIDRLTQVGTIANIYQWDQWGNLTRAGTFDSYYWDDADRLTKYDGFGTANDTSYTYAPASWQRIKRTRQGASMYFAWAGANLRGEYLSDGTLSQSFLMAGLDGQISTTRSSGTYYYLHDGLGSVRNVIDGTETVQNTYDAKAFGQDVVAPAQGVTSPFSYTGAYSDSWESGQGGLYYMRNRYYMPNVGLFTSRDTMEADPAGGWGYVLNNPIGLIDPFGTEPGAVGVPWTDGTRFPPNIPNAQPGDGPCPFDPDDCLHMALNVRDRYLAAGHGDKAATDAAQLFMEACLAIKPHGECPPGFRPWTVSDAEGYPNIGKYIEGDMNYYSHGPGMGRVDFWGNVGGFAASTLIPSAGGIAITTTSGLLSGVTLGGMAVLGATPVGTIAIATVSLAGGGVALGIWGVGQGVAAAAETTGNKPVKCLPNGSPSPAPLMKPQYEWGQ
jgi:RHS repeat-associated protein